MEIRLCSIKFESKVKWVEWVKWVKWVESKEVCVKSSMIVKVTSNVACELSELRNKIYLTLN